MGTDEIKSLVEEVQLSRNIIAKIQYSSTSWYLHESSYTFPIKITLYLKEARFDQLIINEEKEISIRYLFAHPRLDTVKNKKEKIQLIKEAACKLEIKYQLMN